MHPYKLLFLSHERKVLYVAIVQVNFVKMVRRKRATTHFASGELLFPSLTILHSASLYEPTSFLSWRRKIVITCFQFQTPFASIDMATRMDILGNLYTHGNFWHILETIVQQLELNDVEHCKQVSSTWKLIIENCHDLNLRLLTRIISRLFAEASHSKLRSDVDFSKIPYRN